MATLVLRKISGFLSFCTKMPGLCSRGLGIACLAAIFLTFALTQTRNLTSPFDSFDEGWRLMAAKLIALGYEPYTDVYDVDAPLYPIATGFATRVALFLDRDWADSPLPARSVSLIMAIVGAGALALIGKELYGAVGGSIAAFVMLFTPISFSLARRALPEMAAVAMGTVAVWLVIMNWHRREVAWLVLGGIAFGLSLLFKLVFPFLALLLLALRVKIAKPQEWRSSSPIALQIDISSLVWLGLGTLLPVVPLILLLDTRALYEQAWAFHMAGRNLGEESFSILNYGVILWRFIQENIPLILFSIYVVFFSRNQKRWVPLLWLGLALIMLAFQAPVRYRYTAILVPPLSLLVGLFAEALTERWKRLDGRGKHLAIILGLLIIGSYLFELPAIWQANLEETELDREFMQTVDDLHLLLNRAAPNSSFVISDEPALVFYVNKLVPPPITELSKKRVEIGFIDIRELAQAASDYSGAPVLTRSNMSHLQRISGFEQWMMANYLSKIDMHSPSRDLTLYYAPTLDSDCPTTPQSGIILQNGSPWVYHCLQAEVENQITLVSARFAPNVVEAGDSINVILNLKIRSQEFLGADFKALIHLLDTQSHIVAQADHVLFQNTLESVPVDVLLADQNLLAIPEESPSGTYRLVVGFYRADTLERFPIDSSLADDYSVILLGDVEIR